MAFYANPIHFEFLIYIRNKQRRRQQYIHSDIDSALAKKSNISKILKKKHEIYIIETE